MRPGPAAGARAEPARRGGQRGPSPRRPSLSRTDPWPPRSPRDRLPGSRNASEVAEMNGRVVHFEIPYDDGDRARGFYREAFGWQLQSMPGMGYTLVSSGPSDDTGPTEPGFINGGMMSRDDSPS